MDYKVKEYLDNAAEHLFNLPKVLKERAELMIKGVGLEKEYNDIER